MTEPVMFGAEDWVCEKCATPISEEDYNYGGKCADCQHYGCWKCGRNMGEVAWQIYGICGECSDAELEEQEPMTPGYGPSEADKDRMDRAPYDMPEPSPAQVIKPEPKTDDAMLNHLLDARTELNRAWLTGMRAADYGLLDSVSAAYDGITALIHMRIEERTV